jgi:hypothetical protein
MISRPRFGICLVRPATLRTGDLPSLSHPLPGLSLARVKLLPVPFSGPSTLHSLIHSPLALFRSCGPIIGGCVQLQSGGGMGEGDGGDIVLAPQQLADVFKCVSLVRF